MPELTIASFNCHWAHRPSDGSPFDLDAVVEAFDTDVVVIQEVWQPSEAPAVLAGAAERGGYRPIELALSPSYVEPNPEITDRADLATGIWGVALLSRLPVLDTRFPDLGTWTTRFDVAARRRAVVVDLDVGGTLVTLAAVHLSFVLPNAWAQLRRLDAALPRDRPTVVVGDCNLWGPWAARATRRRRAVRGRTWPAPRPHSQLDHVLVSPEVEVVDGRVLPEAGSDHLPIRATLRVAAS